MAPPRRRRKARAWHRWLGVVAAAPLLWLAISGVMLNHPGLFGLEGKEVTAKWVLHRYHQLPEGEARGVDWGEPGSGVEVVGWDGLLFYEGRMLETGGELVGAAPFRGGAAIATPEMVQILSGDGTVVDRLDETVLPETPVEGVVAVADGQSLAVQAGGKRYLFDDDLLNSVEEEESADGFLPVTTLDASQRGELESALASASGIPLARVILDLHTGKLLGWPGWVVTDLSAVSLILLTLLGLRLFPKRKT